jgi:hypothetical protein
MLDQRTYVGHSRLVFATARDLDIDASRPGEVCTCNGPEGNDVHNADQEDALATGKNREAADTVAIPGPAPG